MEYQKTTCLTCGSRIPLGRGACDTCGTPAARATPPTYASQPARFSERQQPHAMVSVGTCPGCGYRGDGISYFSRGSHVAALVGITMLTAGAMGMGGLIYYWLRRDHHVCPRCGRGWGRHGEQALVHAAPPPSPAQSQTGEQVALTARGETLKRAWAIGLYVFAVLIAVVGIANSELAPILLAAAAAGGGMLLQRAASREREARRAALLATLQLPVLRLAAERNGRLTVTQVAAELGWPMQRAEKVLRSLDDGLRVSSEVTDEGLIVYEFLELRRLPEPRD